MLVYAAARRAIPGAAALVLSCAVLAGCGGLAQSTATSRTGGSSSVSTGKLTGNFCTDLENIGTNIPIPPGATGSATSIERRDGRYLNDLAAYYNKLAAEAPPQAGKEIRLIESAYRQLAASIASGGTRSPSQIEQRITSLTSSGTASTAFKQLILYVATKCG